MERDWYLDENRPWVSGVFFRLFRFFDSRGRLKIFLIIPYELMPEAEATTSGAILDLCLWDQLDDEAAGAEVETALVRNVMQAAAGRRILVFLGKACRRKGYGELTKLAGRLKHQLLIVSAGVVSPECAREAAALLRAGMLVEDRRISEEELVSLYGVADYVWCRYDESSNTLSSGIFGRAVQFGKCAVVRPDSYLDRLAEYLDYPVIYDLEPEFDQAINKSTPQSGQARTAWAQNHERLRLMAARSLELLRCSL